MYSRSRANLVQRGVVEGRSQYSGSPNILVLLAVLFLHFTPFYIFGAPITLGFFGLVGFYILYFRVRSLDYLHVAILSGIVVYIVVLFCCNTFDDVQAFQYLKTSVLVFINSFVWCSAFRGGFAVERRSFLRSIELSYKLICLSVWIQYVSYRFFGTDKLFGVFGQFSYLNYVNTPENNGRVRAYGLYLEPSYCALVLITLLICCCLSNYRVKQAFAWTSVGLIAVGSVSGYFALLAVFGLYLFFTATRRPKTAVIMAVCSLVVAMPVVGFNIDYLQSRLSESKTHGTSTDYRFVAPSSVAWKVLNESPFGVGPGQAVRLMSRQNFVNGNTLGTSVDNGFLLVIMYFGWAGVALVLCLLIFALSSIVSLNGAGSFISVYFILAGNFTGGGIFNAEFAFLCCLLAASATIRSHAKFGNL